MFYRPSLFKAVPVLCSVLVLLSSCKENTVIRTDVVPAVDNITVFGTDTLTLLTKSVQDDTVITSAYTSGVSVYMGAGNISVDPFFGKTEASFYFQVRPPQDNYSFDASKYKIDSAVIVLPFSGFSYGDTTNGAGTQVFNAYRLTEDLYFDTLYYAHTPAKNVDPDPIATASVSLPTLFHGFKDSITVDGMKRAPHVRMRIKDKLMNEMIDKTGSSDYVNTKAFITYFKGIYISSQQRSNTITYFRLNGVDPYTTAGIIMYYHTQNSGGTITDTLKVSYPFDPTATQTKTAFFNKVSRDFSGTPVQALFNSATTSDNTVAVQNLPGAAIDLRIPYVKNLPRCIVNKAELVITQIASPFDVLFAPPERLYPEVIDDQGNRFRIADRNPSSSATPLVFIDGNVRPGIAGGKIVNQYVINFPRELQNAIVEQRKELRLRINGTQSFIGAYRLTAAGSTYSQPAYRMKLNVVYTKL